MKKIDSGLSKLQRIQVKKSGRLALALRLYLIFDYLKPQFYLSIINIVRPGLLLTTLTVWFWASQTDKSAFSHRLVKGYAAFIAISLMGVFWSINQHWVVAYSQLILIFLFAGALPIATVLSNKNNIKNFLFFWLAMHFIIAIISIVNHGVGPGGVLEDENDFALCLVMAIPYAVFLIFSNVTTGREKILLALVAFMLILAVAATLSRGGMVGFAAVMMVIITFSKNRLKIITILFLLMVAAVPFLPPTLFKEARSMDNDQDATRVDRLRSWQMGWFMFMDSPILGVGVGNFPWRVAEYEPLMPDYDPNKGNHSGRQAHSLWFTVIPESGAIGTGVFLWLLATMINRCRYVIRCEKKSGNEEAEIYSVLAKGILGSLVGYLVAGSFISVFYYPHFWYLIGFCIGLDLAYQRSTGDVTAKTKTRYRASR